MVPALMEVALKIDVDTHQGLAEGVPRLRRVLERDRATASFYVAMGPDNSGRAIMRVFRNRGFLKKMFRTKAVSMYGLRTILSGTILPARPIALAFPNLLRELKAAGFEVAVHGYDHVLWQDHIDSLGERAIRAELNDAFEAYRSIMAESPRGFAAPGWRTNGAALRALDEMGLNYRTDTRGRTPYRCVVDGRVLTTPEIPSTVATLDEVMGRADLGDNAALLHFYLDQFKPNQLNVHTIHAETEGMGQLENFAALLGALKERGARFVRMDAVASGLNLAELPVCPVVRTEVPGRAGWVAVQGS
ncbi:MAG TPA: polysaccharide deacetylase family protein [Candidatus Binataceae bacterium]|nr:polysaccharide deacetylase family protein [Candidatus Binataceae bacterium]